MFRKGFRRRPPRKVRKDKSSLHHPAPPIFPDWQNLVSSSCFYELAGSRHYVHEVGLLETLCSSVYQRSSDRCQACWGHVA